MNKQQPSSPLSMNSLKGATPSGYKQHSDLFKSSQWRDVWAAVLFLFNMVGFFGLCGYFAYLFLKTSPADPSVRVDISVHTMLSALSGFVASCLLTIGYLGLIRTYPEAIITGSFIGAGFFYLLVGVYTLIKGSWFGIITIVMAAFHFLLYFLWRSRIPFTAILLRTVVTVQRRYPAMYGVVFGGVFATIVVAVAIFLGSSGLYAAHAGRQLSTGALQALGVYMVFSLYWNAQVISNTVHTTIAGVYASYYFCEGTVNAVANPTSESLKRALSYSFGSICLGSLVVALIQTIRFLLRSLFDRNSLAGAIVDCLVGMLEGLVRYFNYYAYTQIAIYGKSFVQAAQDTWDLVKRHSVDMVANDSLVDSVTFIMTLLIGFISGIVAFAVAYIVEPLNLSILVGVLTFFIGMFLPMIASGIIGSGVTATFVCFAEDPGALERSKPELYREVSIRRSRV